MCTNIVLDYMDDLVECFESFIQRSLFAIILALSLIVGSVVYFLKFMSERTLENSASFTGQGTRSDSRNAQRSDDCRVKSRKRDVVRENYLAVQNDDQKRPTTAMAHSNDYDESVLRLVGLSCCTKPCCKSKSKIQEIPGDIETTKSETKMATIIKQEEYDVQQSRSPIPSMPLDIKLEKPSRNDKIRSNNPSPRRSPSPKHSTPSLTICPKAAIPRPVTSKSSQKSCCSMCCNENNQV